MKKTFALALTFLLICSTVALAQGGKAPVRYDTYYGEVKEVAQDGQYSQILVKNEKDQEGGWDEIYLYTMNVPVVDLKTGELVKGHVFRQGEKIQYFFRADTPVMQSLPPQMTPGLIAIGGEDGPYAVDVDFFNQKGHGAANRLVINASKDTLVQNLKGEKVESYLDKDLAVLYTTATRSLPPMTTPEKIIVMDAKTGLVDVADYRAKGDQGIYMRKYYEALGAKVTWNQDMQTATIEVNNKSVQVWADFHDQEPAVSIEDMVIPMKGFFVKDGVSHIPETFVARINDYLLK